MPSKSIADLKARLKSNNPSIKRARELLTTDQSTMLDNAMKIVSKYGQSSWLEADFSSIQTDVILLQSILVNLAHEFGDIMSAMDSDNVVLSTARSKIRLDAKKVKKEMEDQGTPVKVTLSDISDISYEMTEDLASDYEDNKTLGSYLKFVYFALKDHVQLLEKAAHRFYHKGEVL